MFISGRSAYRAVMFRIALSLYDIQAWRYTRRSDSHTDYFPYPGSSGPQVYYSSILLLLVLCALLLLLLLLLLMPFR